MNKGSLLNFGDSWAHGAGVEPAERYADIMAQRWDYPLLDYSQPSTSAARMILQLQTFLDTAYTPGKDYTALFFITAQERQLLFSDTGEPREMHVQSQSDRDYYSEYYTSRLGTLVLNTTLITLQAMCRHYYIKDYYMLGWQYPVLWPTVDTSKFYAGARSNAVNIILNSEHKINFHEINTDAHPGFVHGHP